MKINVHAGHNPDGKIACGAVGFIKESTQARKVKKYVIKYLGMAGHTVYDCTVNDGTSQNDILNKIVKKCNSHAVDLDVSIHFNAGAHGVMSDGKTTGTEVHVYKVANDKVNEVAKNITEKIAKLGFKNRGVKESPQLYVLNSTKAPALLVECCFVDDKDDANLFNAKKMGKAIALGILNSYSYNVITTKKGVYLRKEAVKDIKKAGKLGRLAKGTVCNVSKFKIKDGIMFGYVKKSKAWIAMTNTSLIA